MRTAEGENDVRRSLGYVSIARTTMLIALGALLLTAPACPKKPVPAPAPAAPETEAPAPEPPQQKEPIEQPLPPIKEPPIGEGDIDETIRSQNANRSLLKTVYFDFDKFDVRDDQVPVLQANAAWLKSHGQYKLLVEGHCDERDTIEFNLALGDRRAKSVRQYLIDLGVSADRIRTISYGEERPADPGHDEEAYARNRRGEFTLEK